MQGALQGHASSFPLSEDAHCRTPHPVRVLSSNAHSILEAWLRPWNVARSTPRSLLRNESHTNALCQVSSMTGLGRSLTRS